MNIKYLTTILLAVTLSGCNGGDGDDTTNRNTTTTFNLSGRIFVANNTNKDTDVNDVNTQAQSNDNAFNAQMIFSNPVILGGYVNQIGSGSQGRSQTTGDPDDFFEVDLNAGQTITLFIANKNLTSNDLDLNILNRNGEILNASVGYGNTETLKVPANGRYFIQVHATLGASNYILSIGQDLTQTHNTMQLSNDCIAGEAIVKFKANNILRGQSATNALGLYSYDTDTSREMLFKLEPYQSRLFSNNMIFANEEIAAKYETLMTIKTLARNPDIQEISPNCILRAFRVPNDNLYRYQWNHNQMNLPQAWDITTGDSNVIVAVIDSGVLTQHPDLRANLTDGYDFISNIDISLDGDGLDTNADDPGDQSPGGSSFHGTHVAGIIAAQTNNNAGIAGIGWQTKIMPLRVLGKGGEGTDFDIIQAMRYAAGLANNSGTVPVQRADVINLSLGGDNISDSFQSLINEVRQAGVIVIAASGNEDTDKPMFPASLNGVISVGAVDINKKRASYSSFGSTLDIVAPGGDNTADINGDGMADRILSTMGKEVGNTIEFTFRALDGTSMATPHIAGVISLMKAVNPNLTPQDFDNLLIGGKLTDDLGIIGRDNEYGYGLINAQKAVMAAIELSGGSIPQPAPQLLVNPTSLNFGVGTNSVTLTLTNGGTGDLNIQSITDNSGGILSWQGTGLGDYIIKLDRNNLTTGTFTATITIKTNANTVKVPVIWQVGDTYTTGDAGLHYILLINPDTLETVNQTQASVQDGVYNFSFNNVASGKYIIAAGSDFNNDGNICDIGEACGKFASLDQPTPISVNSDRTGLDFSTGFNINFFSSQSNTNTTSQQGFRRLPNEKSISSFE
jgi:serine protease